MVRKVLTDTIFEQRPERNKEARFVDVCRKGTQAEGTASAKASGRRMLGILQDMKQRGNRVSDYAGLFFTFWKVIFFQLPFKGMKMMIVVPILWMREQEN